MKNVVRLFSVLALVVVAAACEPKPPAGPSVSVELAEWSVKPNVATVAPGKVTFNVTNKGLVDHELVVIKSELAPTALKVVEGKVDEAASGTKIGEIENDELKPSKSASMTLDLTAGSYVLFCNLVGHYQSGMTTGLLVQ